MSLISWAYLLLLSLIWGASFYFIEIGLHSLSPAWLVSLRLVTAATTLLGWLCLKGKFLPRAPSFWLGCLVMGIINNLIPFFLIAWGQQFVTGGMASILNANTAFLGVLVSAVFLQSEPLKLHRIIGVVIGIIGVGTAIGLNPSDGITASKTGAFAILLATLSYALAGVWGKQKLSNWPALHVASGMLICSAIFSIPASFFLSGYPALTLLQPENLPELVQLIFGIGILGTAIAYPLYFRILALAGASNLLLVTIIVPVFAVALDAGLLGQWINSRQLTGFAIVACGLFILDGRWIKGLSPKGL